MPSLAKVEGRWPSIMDRFVGSLFGKVLLARVRPVALEDGLLTLGGRLDTLELKQVESCRQGVEHLLQEDFRLPLRVRFIADDRAPVEAALPDAPAPTTTAVAGPREPWEGDEPEWPEPDVAALENDVDDEGELSLAETAARMFGGEIVPD